MRIVPKFILVLVWEDRLGVLGKAPNARHSHKSLQSARKVRPEASWWFFGVQTSIFYTKIHHHIPVCGPRRNSSILFLFLQRLKQFWRCPTIDSTCKGQIEGFLTCAGGRSFRFFGGFDARGRVSRCAHWPLCAIPTRRERSPSIKQLGKTMSHCAAGFCFVPRGLLICEGEVKPDLFPLWIAPFKFRSGPWHE